MAAPSQFRSQPSAMGRRARWLLVWSWRRCPAAWLSDRLRDLYALADITKFTLFKRGEADKVGTYLPASSTSASEGKGETQGETQASVVDELVDLVEAPVLGDPEPEVPPVPVLVEVPTSEEVEAA